MFLRFLLLDQARRYDLGPFGKRWVLFQPETTLDRGAIHDYPINDCRIVGQGMFESHLAANVVTITIHHSILLLSIMSKHVLDVGNCSPDRASLSRFLKKHFEVEVHQADQVTDALKVLAKEAIDLILVNRKLDIDYSDGLDVIRQIKSNPTYAAIPTMLITNYDEHQEAAMAIGAERGFGKLQYNEPSTLESLTRILA